MAKAVTEEEMVGAVAKRAEEVMARRMAVANEMAVVMRGDQMVVANGVVVVVVVVMRGSRMAEAGGANGERGMMIEGAPTEPNAKDGALWSRDG